MGIKSFFKDLYSVNISTKSTGMSIDDVMSRFNLGGKSATGVNVNPQTAMQHSTVYACIRDKSESIGQLPLKLYRTKSDGTKEEVKKGRDFNLHTKKPNSFMTTQDLVQMYITCLELNGNFYAYTLKNDRGAIMEIIPFRYQTSVVPQMDMNGNVYYTYVTNDNKPHMTFAGDKIMHIKLNSLDGISGMSPIRYNSGAIGLGIGQEKHLSALLKNGAIPKGILETDSVFSDIKDATRLKDEFNEKYAGLENSGKSVLLENGVKFRPLTISPADSELLSSRQYSQQQICGIFRVPPRRIGVQSATKQADVGQENTDYYVNSLMPLVTLYENNYNLLLPEGMEIQVDENGFTRGDSKTKIEVLNSEFKTGSISMNDVRVGMGRQPIDGGEFHAIDTNNFTFGMPTDIPRLQEENRAMALGANNQQTTDTGDDEDEP